MTTGAPHQSPKTMTDNPFKELLRHHQSVTLVILFYWLLLGLAMGVRKGLGAAVGGVFGTAGKITGAAGKAFAILSLDEEYQRKRRQQQQRPPADLQVTPSLR